jgi:hypothetical protein
VGKKGGRKNNRKKLKNSVAFHIMFLRGQFQRYIKKKDCLESSVIKKNKKKFINDERYIKQRML